MPVALTLIKKVIEISSQYLGANKISTCVKHVGTAVIAGATLYQGAKTTAISFFGSITGSYLANRITSRLHSTQSKKTVPTIRVVKQPNELKFLNTTFGANLRKGLASQKTSEPKKIR